MTSTADFQVTGSVSGLSPSSAIGMTLVAGETLTFQLEANPGLDVQSTAFSVVAKSLAGDPDLTLSAGGIPATPLGTVTATAPAAGNVASYDVQCVINGGVDASGRVVPAWTKRRLLALPRADGVRKIVPGETTQHDATYGWVRAINEAIDRYRPVFKTATTARVNNTYSADPHLVLPVLVAGARYRVRLQGKLAQAGAVANFKCKWVAASGLTVTSFALHQRVYAAALVSSAWINALATDHIVTMAAVEHALVFEGELVVNAAGSLEFHWAQDVTDAGATTLGPAHIELQRLA